MAKFVAQWLCETQNSDQLPFLDDVDVQPVQTQEDKEVSVSVQSVQSVQL